MRDNSNTFKKPITHSAVRALALLDEVQCRSANDLHQLGEILQFAVSGRIAAEEQINTFNNNVAA